MKKLPNKLSKTTLIQRIYPLIKPYTSSLRNAKVDKELQI